MKYNLVLHTITKCNYNCTYCDVIKDWNNLSNENVNEIIAFIKKSYKFINNLKFFWWEPLLSFDTIKKIIDSTCDLLWNKFQIVTNTSILNDKIWEYFNMYFEKIFFSIDSENPFNYKKNIDFINKHSLKNKIFLNLIISPKKEEFAYNQFLKLYDEQIKNFNILPVYYTKEWNKNNLHDLSKYLKYILDLSIEDKKIYLYWFKKNDGYNSSLINDSLFIDTDLKVYYSDIVSTNIWLKYKKELYISDLKKISLNELDINDKQDKFNLIEEELIKDIKWQKELHEIMDYFSKYLNTKSN